jgi:hypothetical protein
MASNGNYAFDGLGTGDFLGVDPPRSAILGAVLVTLANML